MVVVLGIYSEYKLLTFQTVTQLYFPLSSLNDPFFLCVCVNLPERGLKYFPVFKANYVTVIQQAADITLLIFFVLVCFNGKVDISCPYTGPREAGGELLLKPSQSIFRSRYSHVWNNFDPVNWRMSKTLNFRIHIWSIYLKYSVPWRWWFSHCCGVRCWDDTHCRLSQKPALWPIISMPVNAHLYQHLVWCPFASLFPRTSEECNS